MTFDITAHLQRFVSEGAPEPGPPPALTGAQRQKRYKEKKRLARAQQIAVLDFETDPFDSVTREVIRPFAGCLLADGLEPIVIWEENYAAFCDAVVAAILSLPGQFTIYAHNGGKFDYLFLIHRLRGAVSFKGRGVMLAKIGPHELRDSFHIIPEKLAAYKKDAFDYTLLKKDKRGKHRAQIIEYMKADCVYLLDIVKSFVKDHGFKLSIGQAAMAALKSEGYHVERCSENFDAFLRNWFFGGRVECLAGKGIFAGPLKLYDVNSMYPRAMAHYEHPVGKSENYTIREGKPGPATVFLDLECDNYGALVCRDDDGETTAHKEHGQFRTTIWEYETALKYGLIDNVKIKWCLDCDTRTNFERFVIPRYEKRRLIKLAIDKLEVDGVSSGEEFDTLSKDSIFLKLLLNNAYGKFAQNPRRFKEHWITDLEERPPADSGEWPELPEYDHDELGYSIWSRPVQRLAFNNVGTAASITGAARAMLMEAICNSSGAVYCDTDSLICRELRMPIDPAALGSWKFEAEFSQVVIAGKKLYGCKSANGAKDKIRSKGAAGVTYQQLVEMIEGEAFSIVSKAPTLTKLSGQSYVTRRVRATAKAPNAALHRQLERLLA